MTSNPSQPPYYILVSQTTHTTASAAPTTTLNHPIIEYHYADDPPHDILPRTPGEQVLVLDYDTQPSGSTIRSIVANTAITGVKVTDAPGAGGADADLAQNNKMFIIETTALQDDKSGMDAMDPYVALARFKQRNAIIRQVIDYGAPGTQPPVPSSEDAHVDGVAWPAGQTSPSS